MSFCSWTMISTSRRQAFSKAARACAKVVAQFSLVLAFVGRRRRQVGRRPRRRRFAQRRDLGLQAGDLRLQARDLILQRGAVLRYRLAGPADLARTTERNLSGLIVEAQETAIDAVEGETAGRGSIARARRFRGGPARAAARPPARPGGSAPARAMPRRPARRQWQMSHFAWRCPPTRALADKPTTGRPTPEPRPAFSVDSHAAVHARLRKAGGKFCI